MPATLRAASVEGVATWEDVRRVASELPEAEEGTSYRRPAMKVRGKMFAALSPHEEGALVVWVDPLEKPLLMEARADVYFSTPHYDGSPTLLIRLADATDDVLRERLEDSWLIKAPHSLVAMLE